MPKITFDQPHDGLTEVGNRLLEAFEADPGRQAEDRIIVLIARPTHDPGHAESCECFDAGVSIAGYDHPRQAFRDLADHIKGIGQSVGVTVKVLPIGLS